MIFQNSKSPNNGWIFTNIYYSFFIFITHKTVLFSWLFHRPLIINLLHIGEKTRIFWFQPTWSFWRSKTISFFLFLSLGVSFLFHIHNSECRLSWTNESSFCFFFFIPNLFSLILYVSEKFEFYRTLKQIVPCT